MKILKVIAIEFFNFIDKFIHQPKILKVLKQKTNNINIFVDVGAHKGTYTDLIINNFDIKKTVMLEPQEKSMLIKLFQMEVLLIQICGLCPHSAVQVMKQLKPFQI